MDLKRYSSNYFNISAWINMKREIFRNIEELPNQRITYNDSLLPLSSLAWEIDNIQNRLYISKLNMIRALHIFLVFSWETNLLHLLIY